jgi:hypothetical protein
LIHYNIKLPYVDFIKGSDLLREIIIKYSIDNLQSLEVIKDIYDYTKESVSLMSMGYLKCMIRNDRHNIEHIILEIKKESCVKKRDIILSQLIWLKELLEAIYSGDLSFSDKVNKDHCKLDDEFFMFMKEHNFVDRDYLIDMYQRIHIDAYNIFYFLESDSYQEVLPLYTSLLSVYKLSLMIVTTISNEVK